MLDLSLLCSLGMLVSMRLFLAVLSPARHIFFPLGSMYRLLRIWRLLVMPETLLAGMLSLSCSIPLENERFRSRHNLIRAIQKCAF